MVVRLYRASLPWIGLLADHYWFVVLEKEGAACERWEVWQSANAGGTSHGHVHCNLKPPQAGVGGGPARKVCEWDGDAAARLVAVLRDAFERYPHRDRYRPWPGPNSNTFVAWALREAAVECRLPWRAIGCRYRRA